MSSLDVEEGAVCEYLQLLPYRHVPDRKNRHTSIGSADMSTSSNQLCDYSQESVPQARVYLFMSSGRTPNPLFGRGRHCRRLDSLTDVAQAPEYTGIRFRRETRQIENYFCRHHAILRYLTDELDLNHVLADGIGNDLEPIADDFFIGHKFWQNKTITIILPRYCPGLA